MTAKAQTQFIRKISLVVTSAANPNVSGFFEEIAAADGTGLDLSNMHIRFQVFQNDEASPSNAVIRVYNLAPSTIKRVQGEFDRVVLQAGYESSAFGVIFDGSIKQYRVGKENATDTYLDILAADGDVGFNFGMLNATVAAGAKVKAQVDAAIAAMGLKNGYTLSLSGTETLRGKVLFGMARDLLSDIARSQKSTWSIQNGAVQIIPLDGYLPGEAVVLNSLTGMIGLPELTDQGVRVKTLLNPILAIGGLIKIDNATLNKTVQANPKDPTVFNQYAGLARRAAESADGLYRVYVIEYMGDNRGQEWYSDITALAVNGISKKVTPYG